MDPVYLKRPVRDQVLIGLAGPSTNVVLGVVAGIGLRLVASPRAVTAIEVLVAFELTQFSLAIFHCFDSGPRRCAAGGVGTSARRGPCLPKRG